MTQKKQLVRALLGLKALSPLDFELSWGGGEAPGEQSHQTGTGGKPPWRLSVSHSHTLKTCIALTGHSCVVSRNIHRGTAMMTRLRQPWEASTCLNPILRVGA